MADARIQWHPGFVAAVELELFADREYLVFEREHNLNRKPLQVDLLVIKERDFQLKNEIGRLFRRYNVMEYKSPRDHLDLGTFYKAQGYACLYKAHGKTAEEYRMRDITVSLVREVKPQGLLLDFQARGILVKNPYPGIYYVEDRAFFPTQIIVTGELKEKEHAWLRALSDRMDKKGMKDFWHKVQRLEGRYEKELADAVWEVNTRANQRIVRELEGDEDMCQAILEIFEPKLNQMRVEIMRESEAVKRKSKEVERESEEIKRESEAVKRKSEEVEQKMKEAEEMVAEAKKSAERAAREIAKREVMQTAEQTAKRLYALNIEIEKIAQGIGCTVETIQGWLGVAANA